MSWPRFLVEELAERRCALFVGNGVALSCTTDDGKRPPSWPELLSELTDLVADDAAESVIKEALEKENYLDAAEIIASLTVPEDRERVMKKILEAEFRPSRWVEICRDLDQNFILTTNYDCIIQDACPKLGFRTHVHTEEEAVKVLRSPERLIYKIHGCIRRTPSKLVLSKSDYHWIQEETPHAIRLLEAILTTHTAVFLGYSMNDPDIQLVLQSIRISFPYAQPHVMLTENKLHKSLQEALAKSLNVRSVTYPIGDHTAGLDLLESLFADVVSHRASLAR